MTNRMNKLTDDEKQQLIIDHTPVIKYIAYRIASRLPPHIEVDDLMSAGAIGLIDAVEKFNPSKETKFKTYAEFRIRGAILDELRSQDWIPRSMRQKSNHIENVYSELEQELGRPATDEDMARFLNIEIDEFHKTIKGIHSLTLLSLDSPVNDERNGSKKSLIDCLTNDSDSNSPHHNARYNEIKRTIARAIDKLPQNEQMIISLYYYEELSMKEVGEVLSITESRVSQIHTKAVLRLRGKLKQFVEI